MKKASLVLGTVIIVCLLIAGWYARGPRQTPPGQPPLTALSADNFAELQRTFNDAPSSVRMVLLLSPT